MSFGWLSTVDGETRRNEWTDITISPRALSRIHRNGKSILGGPVDWDMTPLRQCSQRCSAGYGSGQASSSTGCSPYGLPFIGRSCGLCCEARCLSSGCFKELHFITTVRALDAFKPSPIRENALTCCVVMTGADLRLAVISDSHGRLIAPPNSSFPQ